jgi:hypothetical protein
LLPRLTLLALLSRHLILANGGLILLGHTLHRLRVHRSGLSGRLSRLLRRLLMGALLSLLSLLLGGLLSLLLLLGLLLSVLLLLKGVLLGGHGCLRIMGLGEGVSSSRDVIWWDGCDALWYDLLGESCLLGEADESVGD